jgi:hypothetical protein
MIYQIISPMAYSLNADSFKEAIKNYINFNREMNITQLIIKDQYNHMEARINYYKHDGRNKVGINMYPINYNQSMLPYVSPYSPALPLSPLSPLSSPYAPFIPTVINIPIS